MSNAVLGGWTAWQFEVSQQEQEILQQALGGVLGVRYQGLAVSSQLVAGVNYAFISVATHLTNPEISSLALVRVHVPLQGKAIVQSIQPLGPQPGSGAGSYTSWEFPPPPRAQDVFREATHALLGVEYEALGSTSQIVSGVNYWFLAKSTVVIPDAEPTPVLIQIYQNANDHLLLRHLTPISLNS